MKGSIRRMKERSAKEVEENNETPVNKNEEKGKVERRSLRRHQERKAVGMVVERRARRSGKMT